jgi:hypothetical protein
MGVVVMPTASENFKIVILWEHEIVAAVEAFDRIKKMDSKAPEEERQSAFEAAFTAAYVALYHPEILNGKPLTILSASRDFFPRPGETNGP